MRSRRSPLQEGVVLAEIGSRGVKGSQVSDACASFGTGSAGQGRLVSSIPSEMLEQEAQTFGFEESELALSAKGSPQQIQIRGVIPSGYRVTSIKHGRAVSGNQGSAPILAWENLLLGKR